MGNYGAIVKSTDSGITWSLLDSLTSHSFSSCYFVNPDVGFAVGGQGIIIKTSDSGQNWEFMNSTTSQSLTSIKMQNELIGVVVGSGIILKTIDGGNTWIQKQVITDLTQDKSKDITSYILVQNYPNPFNPNTSIQYAVSSLPTGQAGRQFVTLKVYDVLGNEVATLVNEEKPAGSYKVEFNGDGLTSGVYFYKLRAGSYVEVKKMVLLR